MKSTAYLGFLVIQLLTLCGLSNISNAQSSSSRRRTSQSESPCPQIFTYESSTNEAGRWYGSVSISSDVTLYGVWIDVVLDRTADSIGNWFGTVSSSDSKEFKIENQDFILNSDSPNSVRFFVKYNTEKVIPRLQNLRLNGREICVSSSGATRRVIPLQNSTPRREINEDNTYKVTSNANSGQSSYNDDSNRDTIDSLSSTYPKSNPKGNPRVQSNDDLPYSRPSSTNTRIQSSAENEQPVRGTSAFLSGSQSQSRPQSSGSPFGSEYSPNSGSSRETSAAVGQQSRGSQTYPQNSRPSSSANDYSNNNADSSSDSYSQNSPNVFSRPQATTTSRTIIARKPANTRQTFNSADYSGGEDADTESSSTTRRTSWANTGDSDYFEGDHRLSPESKIKTRPPPRQRDTEQQSEECGKVALQPAPLIVGNQATKPGQWPWHVALYQSQTVDNKYICGGSLISMRFVITAAHCVTRRTTAKAVNVQTLTVYLGKFNLRKSTDGVQIMLVRKIYVHDDYSATSYYADLALLKLSKTAEYTNTVRPVCLWNEDDINLSNIVGKQGSVVGWGFDETSHVTEELALAKMPVVEQATCLWSFKEFFLQFTSNHTYCAGFANGTSVCNGDSGGGMVFPDNNGYNPTWRLRGLVSISVAKQNEVKCDPYHYVVFSDIAQFLDWIKEKISL